MEATDTFKTIYFEDCAVFVVTEYYGVISSILDSLSLP